MPLDQPAFASFERRRAPRDLRDGEGHLQAIRDHILRFGWHIHGVFADPGRIAWHYTIGFMDTFGRPDLVVFGLDDRVAQVLLNDVGDALASGSIFTPGHRYGGFLVDVDIEFQPTLPRWSPAHFGRAADWYGRFEDMWQIVLPDSDNRFPGEPEERASRFQLLLAEDRPAPSPLSHEHTPIDVPDGWTALIPDVLGEDETGWEELVVLVKGSNDERWVVASVPFVDQIVFGDEVAATFDAAGDLRIQAVTQHAPAATVRICILQGGEQTRLAVDQLIEAAAAHDVVWESPVKFWFFFGVPHHGFEWFMDATQSLVDQRIIGRRVTRAPSP